MTHPLTPTQQETRVNKTQPKDASEAAPSIRGASLRQAIGRLPPPHAAAPCDNYRPDGTDACEKCGHSMYSHDLSKSDYIAGLAVDYHTARRQAQSRQPLPAGTPIRWYHRLWWRVKRWWS